MKYHATKRENAERRFDCAACGTCAVVLLEAIGKSGWHRENVFRADGDAEASAVHEAGVQLMLDAERVLGLVRCPVCRRRAPGAVTWACVRVGIWVALALGLAAVSGGKDGNAIWAAMGFGALAIVFAVRELSRYSRAGRVMFTSVVRGTPPPSRDTSPKMPKARAVAVPRPPTVAAATPRPVPAPTPRPAPAPPPPSPDGGPRYLRD